MNHTSNYHLNQWEPTDQVRRVDFNADNAKIDAALKGVDAKAEALSEHKAETSALEALSQRVTAQGTALTNHAASMTKLGNCQIYTITYTGNGSSSRSFSFPHRPMMVFVYGASYTFSAMFGISTGHGRTGGEGSTSLVSWGARDIQWEGGRDVDYICNSSGKSYRLVALLDMEN